MWIPPAVTLRPVFAALLLGLAALGPASAADPMQVTGVRLGLHPDKTRFVLDLSAPADFKVFLLADPYRVVIDLPDLDWTAGAPVPDHAGLIEGFRYGLFTPGTFRVVLDLKGPARVKNSMLLPARGGHSPRLVLDLAPQSREDFMAALKSAPQLAEVQPRPLPVKPAPKPGKKIVVLDPGHGGVDPGAKGRSGVFEKVLTLAMGKELKRQLEATGRYQVVLTRDTDIFIPLRQRIAIARAASADLFVSLHADSIDDRGVRGLSVYTLSETASDKEAAALAVSENKADVIAGIDLTNENAEVTNILIDLAQRETMNLSANFAEIAVDELGSETRLLHKTHRFAGFAVLKAPDVPSVLVELGYLSNAGEEKNLRTPAYRARLAAALVKGIDRYFNWKDGLTKTEAGAAALPRP